MSIAVLGAGAFGTALAISLAKNTPVTLWARNADHVTQMAQQRENALRLPEAGFPDMLHVSDDLRQSCKSDVILLALPLQRLRAFLSAHQTLLAGKPLVACSKGVEISSGMGPVALIQDCITSASPAILTGPSFASDIAKGLPTALTLACANEVHGTSLQAKLSTENLRLYRTQDVIGAELGGALKNVIAIACGAVIGAGLGESARAALMTRGFAEMNRLAQHKGGHPQTLAGLSGFGDLTLTCASEQSRNFRLGLALGRNQKFDPTITVEGAATAKAVAKYAQNANLDMPITQTVTNLVEQNLTITQAAEHLFKRPLKEE